jgi:hypothetical protein
MSTAILPYPTRATRARLRVLRNSVLDCDIVVDDLRREGCEENDPRLVAALDMRAAVAADLAALITELGGV